MLTLRNIGERMRSFLRSPLGRHSLVIFIAFRMGDVALLVAKVFLGRRLPAIEFGAIEPFMSVLSLLCLPISIASESAVKTLSRLSAMKEHAKHRALLRHMLFWGMGASLFLVAVVLAFEEYIRIRLHLEADRSLIHIMAGLAFLIPWPTILMAVLRGDQRYTAYSVISAALPVTTFAVTVVFTTMWGLRGALAARAAASIVAVGGILVLVVPLLRGPTEFYPEELSNLKRTLSPMLVLVVCSSVLTHFDRLFVRNFMVSQSGGYGAAITLGQIPLWLVSSTTAVLLPLASANHALGKDTMTIRRQTLALGAIATVSCTILLAIVARPLLRAWNPDFVSSSSYVWLYSLAMGVDSMISMVASVDISKHRYAGFWWMAVITPLSCAIVYSLRSTITIQQMLTMLVAGRALVLAGMSGVFSVFRSSRSARA